MTTEISEIEGVPSQIRAGDTTSFQVKLDDFTNDNWNLNFKIINQSESLTLITVPGVKLEIFVVSPIVISLSAGLYNIVGQVANKNDAQEKYSIHFSSIQILPDLFSANTYDTRSTAQKMLEILDEAMLLHGNNAFKQSYSIQGRNMTFTSHNEFMDFRKRIYFEAQRDTRKQQGKKRLHNIRNFV